MPGSPQNGSRSQVKQRDCRPRTEKAPPKAALVRASAMGMGDAPGIRPYCTLHLVIRPIPVHKFCHAYLDGGGGREAGVPHQGVYVGIGGRYVVRLHRQQVLDRLFAQSLLQEGDEGEQLNGTGGADIVEAVRRGTGGRIRGGARPGGIGRGGPVQHTDNSFDNILYIRKVPLHVPIVVHVDGLALQDRLCKLEEGHVRAAPGTVDRKEAQAGRRQAVEMAVRMGHELVGLLAGGIETEGVVYVVMHGKGYLRIRAVDGGGRGEYEMPDTGMAAAFQDVEEADDVAFDIDVRIFPRVPHARLGRELDHRVDLVIGKEGGYALAVGQVAPVEGELGTGGQLCQPRLFEADVVVMVEVV